MHECLHARSTCTVARARARARARTRYTSKVTVKVKHGSFINYHHPLFNFGSALKATDAFDVRKGDPLTTFRLAFGG